MACKCQKPCKKDICCSVCPEVKSCKERCAICASKKQVNKEKPKKQRED